MSDQAPRAKALSNRYAIECELGASEMATVYLAEDLKHDREVAGAAGSADPAGTVRQVKQAIELEATCER